MSKRDSESPASHPDAKQLDPSSEASHIHAALDGIAIATLRERKCEKWNTYPADVLPAWVAEMDFPLADPIRAELQRAVDRWDFGYPIALRDTGLRETFCARMHDRFGWSIDPDRVEIISEVVQGFYSGLQAFSNSGDGVVVQTPIYPPFLSSVRNTRRRLIENRLVARGGHFEIDFDALAASADSGTRVFMLCNPHNPTGRVFSQSELERLAEFVLSEDWIVISDEIHADLVYPGHRHIPFASLSPQLAERTMTLNSASKAFNIPGLRCAVAHFGSAELQRQFSGGVARHLRGGLGILGIYATLAAWGQSDVWLSEVRAYLESNRDFALANLAERLPAIKAYQPEATYLCWLDCAALEVQGSPAAHLMREGKVALSDGRVFGKGWEDHVRLNFATSRSILTEVLDRMALGFSRQRTPR